LVLEVGDGPPWAVFIPQIVHAETRRAELKPLTLLWCVKACSSEHSIDSDQSAFNESARVRNWL
jgi:hypothetical protein